MEEVSSSLLDKLAPPFLCYKHIPGITLSRRRPTTTVRSNDTLGNTSFQLISDFFHVNQGV